MIASGREKNVKERGDLVVDQIDNTVIRAKCSSINAMAHRMSLIVGWRTNMTSRIESARSRGSEN